MHDIQIDMLRIIGENPAYSAYRNIRFCICQAQIHMEDRLITLPMLGQRLRSCMPGSVPQDRHMRSRGVPHEHLASGSYMSTQRASLSISAQLAAHIVVAPSAKKRSRVRSSGPVRDGETKILNAPTCKANHMIMRIRCVVCTKSKASTKRVR